MKQYELGLGVAPTLPKKGKMCNKCGTYKAYKYFYRCTPSPDGYRGACKDCEAKQQKEIRDRMKKRCDYICIEEKVCSECGRLLPISSFLKDCTKTDNHKSYCKNCARQQQIHRRRMELIKKPTSRL